MACVFGEPVWVSARAAAEELEEKRLAVQAALNAVEARAYALADGKGGAAHG
jgi:hypothetical protein